VSCGVKSSDSNLQCSGGRYEHRSESCGSINGGSFLDQLTDQ